VEITGAVDQTCQHIVTENEVMVNKLCKTVYLCPFNPLTRLQSFIFFATNEVMVIVSMVTVL
jgi:hypothetical protein